MVNGADGEDGCGDDREYKREDERNLVKGKAKRQSAESIWLKFQDAIVAVILAGVDKKEVLNMDYESFMSLKDSMDRVEAARRLQDLNMLACVQGDGKSYKKIMKMYQATLDTDKKITPQR